MFGTAGIIDSRADVDMLIKASLSYGLLCGFVSDFKVKSFEFELIVIRLIIESLIVFVFHLILFDVAV